MLKIKKEIDLKELEKFGFEFLHNYLWEKKIYVDNKKHGGLSIVSDMRIWINKSNRNIELYILREENEEEEYQFEYSMYDEIDIIFDLIQAGLVENI